MTTPLEARRQILEGLGEHEQAAAHPPFEAFLDDVRRRLERGRAVFADRSLERSGPELLTEIQEELADVAGWSAILWARLERLRALLADVDPDDPEDPPTALVGVECPAAVEPLPDPERERAVRVMGGRAE